MFWYVSLVDCDVFFGYVYLQNWENELFEIYYCVGKEVSKYMWKRIWMQKCLVYSVCNVRVEINEWDCIDYFNFFQVFFFDYCCVVVSRYYFCDDVVKKEFV